MKPFSPETLRRYELCQHDTLKADCAKCKAYVQGLTCGRCGKIETRDDVVQVTVFRRDPRFRTHLEAYCKPCGAVLTDWLEEKGFMKPEVRE